MDVDRADLIYHESQTAALCGVHALNSLLQAPHFSEIELAEIARELDAAEHALMASGGIESAEFLQYMAEGSGNVAENGMFSIQVLSKALEVFGLQAVPMSSPDAAAARADPTTQEAFICHLQEHWFTVRSIHGQWWNLNSIYSAPEPLSAFHLAAYLGSLREEGYTIFVIVGDLPSSQPPAGDAERFVPGQAGRWFTPEESRAATEEREKLKKQGFVQAVAQGVVGKASVGRGTWLTLRRPGAKRSLDEEEGAAAEGLQGDDPDLARALAASLSQPDGGPNGSRPQTRSAWGAPVALPAASVGAGPLHGGLNDDEDADLAAAIAASLADHAVVHSGGGDGSAQQQQGDERQAAAGAPVSSSSAAQQAPMPAGHAVMHAMDGDDEDAELAAAIAASLQRPASGDGGGDQPADQHSNQQQLEQQQQKQSEQQQAEQQQAEQEGPAAAAPPPASVPALPELGPEPEAGAPGVIEVALRLPGGGRARRRFRSQQDSVGHLASFAAAQGAADVAAGGCQLAAQFPRRVFDDWGASLADAGVGHKELVTVEPR